MSKGMLMKSLFSFFPKNIRKRVLVSAAVHGCASYLAIWLLLCSSVGFFLFLLFLLIFHPRISPPRSIIRVESHRWPEVRHIDNSFHFWQRPYSLRSVKVAAYRGSYTMAPVDASLRKRVLKVVFVSLLLDLVSAMTT